MDNLAGLKLAEDINAAINDGLRVFPDGVEAGDIIYALLRNLAERGETYGMTVGEISLAWAEYNRGRMH